MKSKYVMTIFTPTYNRAELLARLYESLAKQTNKNFEWVVVDDGSSDGTEKWIQTVLLSSPFEMKYHMNQHGGKHRAINKGVEMANGEFVFFVDSDDYLPSGSIETIAKWINDVEDRRYLAAISGLRMDTEGNIIGERPDIEEGDYIECSNLKRYRMHLMGDKAEIYRTEILKKYPFPEFDQEYFVTERIVWDKIAAEGYKVRWYNTPIYICEYQQSGLSKSGANQMKGHLDNYLGYVAFVKQAIRVMEPMEAVTYFREYNHTAKFKRLKLTQRAKELDVSFPYYMFYLAVKMPVFYTGRMFFRVFYRLNSPK